MIPGLRKSQFCPNLFIGSFSTSWTLPLVTTCLFPPPSWYLKTSRNAATQLGAHVNLGLVSFVSEGAFANSGEITLKLCFWRPRSAWGHASRIKWSRVRRAMECSLCDRTVIRESSNCLHPYKVGPFLGRRWELSNQQWMEITLRVLRSWQHKQHGNHALASPTGASQTTSWALACLSIS